METPCSEQLILCGFCLNMSVGIQIDVLLVSIAVKLNYLNFVHYTC